jgi:hypothetical protein
MASRVGAANLKNLKLKLGPGPGLMILLSIGGRDLRLTGSLTVDSARPMGSCQCGWFACTQGMISTPGPGR